MNIKQNLENKTLTLTVEGRLDTATAPSLESAIRESVSGVEVLVLDFAALDYISSAGLRVLLGTQKLMNKQGTMIVRNVNDTVREVFDITGFSDILTIQ